MPSYDTHVAGQWLGAQVGNLKHHIPTISNCIVKFLGPFGTYIFGKLTWFWEDQGPFFSSYSFHREEQDTLPPVATQTQRAGKAPVEDD